MIKKDKIPIEWLPILERRLQGRKEKFLIPPPVLEAMKGELLDYDIVKGSLKAKFPVLSSQLNPYGHMQAGIISAAIDNTIGPLSMLVSPPNFTRHMEVKYGKVVTPDLVMRFLGNLLDGFKGLARVNVFMPLPSTMPSVIVGRMV